MRNKKEEFEQYLALLDKASKLNQWQQEAERDILDMEAAAESLYGTCEDEAVCAKINELYEKKLNIELELAETEAEIVRFQLKALKED